jgi:Glyoxalase-like domain
MPQRIDHVITATPNLDQLEATFIRLGFSVVGGGKHPHLGTRNRIILLDQGYIELLAIADEQAVSPAVHQRIATTPGWIGFALQSADITNEAAAMRQRGADARGPAPGRLVAPSGSVRSWQSVRIGGDDLLSAAEPLPFLIQHDSAGTRHQQELAGADSISPHPNGALRLQTVTIAVANLSEAQAAFAQAYDLTPTGAPYRETALEAERLTLALPLGGERIVLAQPTDDGLVLDRLAAAGEGVCCVSVVVERIAATRDYLERQGITCEPRDSELLVPAAVAGGVPLIFVDQEN